MKDNWYMFKLLDIDLRAKDMDLSAKDIDVSKYTEDFLLISSWALGEVQKVVPWDPGWAGSFIILYVCCGDKGIIKFSARSAN